MNPIPDLHPPSSRRRGMMLCYPFEEKRLQKWGVPRIIIQPKLDGERCRALIANGQVLLLSSEQNPILSVPHIVDELRQMFPSETIELDGELYIHGEEFSQIHSVVGRTANIVSSEMQLHIFDVINTDEQIERLTTLRKLDTSRDYIKTVPSILVKPTVNDVLETMHTFTEDGYEGVILRHPFAAYERKRSTNIMKFKPKKSDYYRIVGFQEEVSQDGIPKGTLGAFICTGSDGTEFGVGTGFSADQRRRYWQERACLLGGYVKVNYQSITPKHVPRFPVFVSIESPDPGEEG